MWTKKAILVTSTAIMLIIFGLIFRNLPLVIICAAMLSYIFVSMMANRLSIIEPFRQLSNEKIFEDGTIKTELRLTNKGGKTGFLEVRDKLPTEFDLVRGSNYTYLNLPPHGKSRIRYSVKCPIKVCKSFP